MTGRLQKLGFCVLLITPTAGCAGRATGPVIVYQHGDEKRSCDALGSELELIEEEITKLLPETHETRNNVALGVSGMFLIAARFFMNLIDVEKTEVNVPRKRHNHLVALGEGKGRGFEMEQLPASN